MTNKLRWGLIGTGGIARQFAEGLKTSHHGELFAVGSRTQEAADRFVADFPARAYASYEALIDDPEVDAVYISTPHPWHEEWAVRAAAAGKAILCEKPLTVDQRAAERVVAAARRNDVFLMEAFMYRTHPQTRRLVELLQSQPIGEVRFIRASFSFDMTANRESWIFDHARAGGGILALGCYCTSMSRLIAGVVSGKPFAEPEVVSGAGMIGEVSRVDEMALGSLRFPGGLVAEIAAGSRVGLENNVRIVGTEGSILLPSPWIVAERGGFSKILVFKDGIPEEIVIESDRTPYGYEADHVAERIAAGHKDSDWMPLGDSIGNMRTLDQWRAAVGLRYDGEA